MNLQNLLFSTGLAVSTTLAISSTAQAAIFTSNFTPSPNPDPKKDIFLNSITQNGTTFVAGVDLLLVESAKINFNTPFSISIPSSGGASTDRGDQASNPGFPPNPDPTAAEVAAYLGNYNLNNIIDSEDSGAYNIDLFFERSIVGDKNGLDNFFFYERGLNSDILVQAIDAGGNIVGSSYTITRNLWTAAGYSIDTTEVPGSQPVGSYGVSYANLGLSTSTVLSGLRIIAQRNFNGPDFKVVAKSAPIPEPTTILGLGSVAALALLRRRQMKAAKNI